MKNSCFSGEWRTAVFRPRDRNWTCAGGSGRRRPARLMESERMTTREIFDTMDYGPAPESDAEARPGSPCAARLRAFHRRGVHRIRGDLRHEEPRARRDWPGHAGSTDDVDAAVAPRPRARNGRSCRPRAREIPLRNRPAPAEARPPLRGAGNARQRQADPRGRDIDVPLAQRHFYYHAGIAQLMQKNCPGGTAGRLRPDHPVELPAPDAGLEDRAGARRRATRWC
jgi:hypothetical protein